MRLYQVGATSVPYRSDAKNTVSYSWISKVKPLELNIQVLTVHNPYLTVPYRYALTRIQPYLSK